MTLFLLSIGGSRIFKKGAWEQQLLLPGWQPPPSWPPCYMHLGGRLYCSSSSLTLLLFASPPFPSVLNDISLPLPQPLSLSFCLWSQGDFSCPTTSTLLDVPLLFHLGLQGPACGFRHTEVFSALKF